MQKVKKHSMLRPNPLGPVKLAIRKSNLHRWGVFAKKFISAYEIIEEAPFFSVDRKQINKVPSCHKYSYYLDCQTNIIGLGYAGLYNHSYTPNCSYEVDYVNELMRHYALCDIVAGEEITLDYGEENAKYFLKGEN